MISRKYVIVIVLALVCITLFGWQRINIDERLQPIKGKWIHKACNSQVWTYNIKSNNKVHFSIDHQSTQWSVAGIEASGGTVQIRVNDPGTEIITFRKLNNHSVLISSRLHPPMTFKR